MSQSQRGNAEKTRVKAGKPATAATLVTAPPASGTRSSISPTTTHATDGMQDALAQLFTKLTNLEATMHNNVCKTDDLVRTTDEIKTAVRLDTDRLASLMEDHNKQHKQEIEHLKSLLNEKSVMYDLAFNKLKTVEHAMLLAHAKNKKLELIINDINDRARLCNLKLDGKPEETKEDLHLFITDMAKYLDADPNTVINAYRLGKISTRQQGKSYRPRPIMMEFVSIRERNKFYFARTKLKDTPEYKGIYVNDDVTPMTHKFRDDFRSVAALARSVGSEVRMHGDGVVIDGVKYKLTSPDSLPAKFTLEKAKVVEMHGGLYFQSEHAFLSNFYPSPILKDGVLYSTAEHCFQAEKCRHAHDEGRLNRVLMADTPLDAKKIADQIGESAEWRNIKLEVMTKVIDLKFTQNKKLALKLIDTGDLSLHEATKNSFFGIGASLHSKELRDRAYKGLNKLGWALQELRAKIRM